MSNLVKYDAACRALAAAKSVDEVKDIRDKAEAMRAYAKQAKNKALEVDAAEIRMRAERRLGELIQAQKETVGLQAGARGRKGGGTRGSRKEPQVKQQPTLKEAGIDKKLSSRAQRLAAVPEKQFEGMLGEWRENVAKEGERVTTRLLRAGDHAARDKKLASKVLAWPRGKFPILYADPPWRYENPPIGASNRAVENKYPTMTLEEICALPVSDIATPDAMLYLWATAPKLAECMEVITAWGFIYRTCMVWVKDKIGMGYHVRNQHEILLIAKRGELPPPPESERCSSVVHAKRGKHSEKPDKFYGIIERMYPSLDKIELFARAPRKGWVAWGNQAEK